MNELPSHAAQLLAAMNGSPLPEDLEDDVAAVCARLTPREMGALLPSAYRTAHGDHSAAGAPRVARALRWSGVGPEFTAATLAQLYAAPAGAPHPLAVLYAARALPRCAGPWEPDVLARDAEILVAAVPLEAASGRTAVAALAAAGAAAGPDRCPIRVRSSRPR